MTDVKRLLDEATPLPWTVYDAPRPGIGSADRNVVYASTFTSGFGGVGRPEDAALIVYAVNLLPRFLTLYEEAATVINSDEAFNADDSSRMPALAAAVDALAELDE